MEGGFIFLGAGLCPRCGFRQFLWGYGPHTLCSICRKEFTMHMERVITITDSHVFISDSMPEDDAKGLMSSILHGSLHAEASNVLRVEGLLNGGMLRILDQWRHA